MSILFKDCPFCGFGNNLVIRAVDINLAVECLWCLVRGPRSTNEDECIELWNKRASGEETMVLPADEISKIIADWGLPAPSRADLNHVAWEKIAVAMRWADVRIKNLVTVVDGLRAGDRETVRRDTPLAEIGERAIEMLVAIERSLEAMHKTIDKARVGL